MLTGLFFARISRCVLETHNPLLYSIAQNRFKVYIFFKSKKMREKQWKNAGISVIINKPIRIPMQGR